MKSLLFIVLFAQNVFASQKVDFKIIPEMFSKVASEMERLDGEGLYVRQNRQEPWPQTIAKLKEESLKIKSNKEMMLLFSRLNLAYTNRHSSFRPGPSLMREMPKFDKFPFAFLGEWLAPNDVTYRVFKAENPEIKAGDEILSINKTAMKDWANQYFNFCKFPIKAQCDVEMAEQFEVVFDLAKTVTVEVKRDDKIISTTLNLKDVAPNTSRAPKVECKDQANRYQDFNLVYTGRFLCIYQSEKYPKLALMRIPTFNYSVESREHPIPSIGQEIEKVLPWWQKNATWDDLIIDVTDNHGGNWTIPYYKVLLQKPFQEQFFRIKKFTELSDITVRQGVFWNSEGLLNWFDRLYNSPAWDQIKIGEFLPMVPMFCASSTECEKALFEPYSHSFKGNVSVLLNEWCVSSCDAFVYTIKENFPDARFYGHPQTGDTAFSRVRIDVTVDNNVVKTTLNPIHSKTEENVIISQIVSVTRSFDSQNKVMSGVTVPLTRFVPLTLENKDQWHQEVLKEALKDVN